jgi:hypothetical protein
MCGALVVLLMTGKSQAQTADFGDYNAFGSASSTVVTTLKIGATTDKESTATTNATATGDDTTGTDDEDGVTIATSVAQGTASSMTVNVTNTTGSTAYLNVWIDFNRNGVLTDAGEQVAVNTTIATGTSNSNRTVNFTVPATASLGTAGVRVRLTSTSTPGATTVSGNGEVEDTVVTIIPNTDFGDYPSFASASQIFSSDIRVGTNATDSEATNPTTGLATADDTSGTDDEDLTMPTFAIGRATNLVIPVTIPVLANISGSTSRINVFADWNGDGDVADTNETLTAQTVATAGTSNVTFSLTPPAGTVSGTKYLRIRITEGATAPTFSGTAALKGEVEDYAVTVNAITDFGDYPSFASASQIAGVDLKIGTNATDVEDINPTTGSATADDTTGTDDEDLVMPTFTVGMANNLVIPVTIPVLANLSGSTSRLNVFVDWNGDGDVADTNETLTAQTVAAAGTSNVTFSLTPPVNTTAGTKYLRLRLTEGSTAPAFSGTAALEGEVEDYAITVQTVSDFGDYSSFGSVSNVANSRLRLGALVDVESAAVTNDTATGDDTNGSDDEDGAVVPATVFLGQSATISVTRTNTIGVTGYLNGWLDFNRNGGLTEANEKVINNVSVANGTSNSAVNYTFTVPADAGLGLAGLRLRLARTSGLGPTGTENSNGEVEDYRVTIACPTITLSPTSLANGTVGTAYSQTVTASGVATTWTYSRSSGTLPGGLTLNSSTGVLSGTPTSAGSFNFTIAATGANGCSASQAYTVVVSNPPTDFGDYSGFTDASSIVVSTLKIGATTDDETTAATNPFATGDDTSGSDDEDGVTLPPSLHQGTASSMTVNVTNTSGSTAFLNVWIDFNRNGVLTDAGEQVAVNTTISNGTSNSNRTINFTVPAGAFQGNTAARVRLTSTSSPGATGASGNGEVEDHLVRTCPLMVVCPAVSILPVGTVGSAYSLPISALGGSGGFVFAVSSGSAPAGLTLNASTGLLSGTPTTVQTRTFAVTATDSSGCTISRNYTMSIVGAGSTVQVYGEAGTNNVPITAASYVVNGATRIQSSDQSGSSVAVNTNSAINLSTLTLNDNGESKTLNVVNLNGGSVSNVTVSASNGSFGVLLNGTATSIASSGLTAFQNSAAQISTNNNLNHYIFDDRGEGEPDGTGEYDIRFNYAFTAEDYVVCQERFGNSHIQLQALDATGNIIPGSRTVQVRGTHDWNTGYASASYISDQPYFLTVIRHGIFGTPSPIFGFRLSVAGADCKFFGMSDNPFTDNPTNAGVVGDKVWNDVNKNGIQDSGESGVNGVTVRLLNAATSDTVATTTTDGSGIYNFTAVAPGDYRVEFVAPFNHAFTSKDLGGDDRLDSDADTSTGRSDIFTMLPCDSISYIDAGVLVLPTTDFGDYSAFGSASSTVLSSLRIGTLSDAEGGPATNAAATGDDLDGTDDEEGVSVPAGIEQGAPGSITAIVNNNSGSLAYLNAWIDFNRNGVLTDAGEQIAADINLPTGTTNVSRVINFTSPAAASLGAAGVRVRLTSVAAPGTDGLDGNGEVEDYLVTIGPPTTDFGDELDFANASSTASTSLRLGSSVDTEGSPTKTANADGDDVTTSDDEDAVAFPSLTAGQPVTLPVNVTNTTASPGYLNAWIDFNNNGVLTDAGEQIVTNILVPAGTIAGTQTLNFNVPSNAVTASTSLGTRFRLTDVQDPGPVGFIGIGEVEDHPVIILAPLTDFGDFSGAPEVSNTASTNLRLGSLVDTEYASTRNTSATGDDTSGVDDEDGVTLPAMTAGAPATITAVVTNNTGASAYLNVWIDFNNNGVFTDLGEQVSSNVLVATATNNVARNIGLTVPATAVTGTNLGLRVRLSSDLSPGSSGAGGVGEVEDYVVTIAPPTTDFGDFNGFGSASSIVDSRIKLGALTDTEFAQTANATATGDDITASDDEDAVTLPSLTAGGPATIPVLVTNTSGAVAYLDAWIDFNNNGVLTDVGEQVAVDVPIATGTSNATQNLAITVPATALTGVNVGVRFRLTSAISATSTGASGNGEVEDYVVIILAPTTDFGDFSGFADASQGANPALRMGALLDTEFVSTRNATATGDDTTGSDDEDGVTLPSMIAGQTVNIPVTITNNTGANGFLNAWFDFNNNNVLTDSGEQIATNIIIPSSTTDGVTNLTVTVPANAVTGTNVGLRFRLSAPSGLGATGTNSLAGEIEDYVVNIAAPTTDFGDHALLSAASSTMSANLLLGTAVDAEFAATTNAAATGDDITGGDDEDGVTMPASLDPSTTISLPVTVQNRTGANAWMHAWIDFNNDGVLNDTLVSSGGERLEAARLIPGLNTGTILREYWTGIAGASVSNLTSSAAYPNSPTSFDYRANFTAPVDWADNMGQRMRGWVYPPVSGQYTFWISGDDETQLFLSTDETPANATMIANVPTWTGSLQWNTFTSQKSVKITLEAGKPYYIEALMKEGAGGDNLAAAWELPGTSTGPVVIAGQYLAPWVSGGQVFKPSHQINLTVPLNVSAGPNRAVRFRLTNSSTSGPTGASGTGEVEDYAVLINSPSNDFSDWSRAVTASNGLDNNLFMGASVDAEYVVTANTSATGDDLNGTDDEDGVTLPSLIAGGTFNTPVTVTNLTGSPAYLNAWIDFNNNGFFTDAGEQVVTNLTVVNGSSSLSISPPVAVPASAVTGTSVGVRFRLTSSASPGATGTGGGIGEVEDYVVTIAAPTTDLGDFSRFATASSTASNSLRIGTLVDAEYVLSNNLTATADDTNGSDDEDGVTVPSMMAGAPATLPVTVTNSTGASGFLNVWIDFNNNGVLTDAGEQVASNVVIATGTANGVRNLSFTVPPTALTVTSLGMRVRLTSVSSPAATGAAGTGEVEDYVVTISAPPLDYGDWSGLADASSTVVSGLSLGALTDTEFASTRNTAASGDDNTELDDEDGVTLPSMIAGAPATIPVVVTNTTGAPAYLNAWFDFNNNGSVADAGEQIATNTLVANGTTNATVNLNLTIPASTVTGASLGLRFRLTSVISPGVTGNSGNGEVEDYTANVAVPVTDFGDWSGAANASNIASSDLRMGALADTEFVSTLNSAATADDITGSDDEDGVTLPTLTPGTTGGATGSATVVVTNNTGSPAYLNAWIDFNNNGTFADAGEQIATNITVATGSNGVNQNLSFSVPVNSVPGTRGARFRLTSAQNPTPTGSGGMGEVEDHMALVSCLPFSVNPATLPAATVGTAYSQTLTNTAIHAPVVYQLSGGSLPAGLSFDSATAIISGTPSSPSPANFTITATDANGCTSSREYTMTPVCAAISITPASLNQGAVGSFYSQTFTAAGGLTPHGSWAVASGSLPAGLNLNPATGVLSGTPSGAGLASFTIRVNDASVVTSVTTPSSPVVAPVYNQSYADAVTGTNSFQSGGLWRWRVTPGADVHANDVYERPTAQSYEQYPEGYATKDVEYYGNLDITEGLSAMDGKYAYFGIRLYSRNKVTADGTQTAEGLNYQYGVRLATAADSRGGLLVITDQPEAKNGTNWGGNSLFVYRDTNNDLNINGNGYESVIASDGKIGGAGAVIAFSRVSPSNNKMVEIAIDYAALGFTRAQMEALGRVVFEANKGTKDPGNYLWNKEYTGSQAGSPNGGSGGLSEFGTSGLGNVYELDTLNGASLVMPSSQGCTGTRAYTVRICPVVTLTPASLPNTTVGTAYTQTVSASGGATPYAYAVSSGSLPSGLTLNPGTGVISGTPTAAATSNFTIRATDANGCSGTRAYTIVSGCPVLGISPLSLPAAYFGGSYTQALTASNGTAPYTYVIQTGALPTGLFLATNGVISGVPSVTGLFTFTVRVADTYGCSTSFDYTLNVRSLSLGNLVFEDSNSNGSKDAAEPGVGGALVQLFATGDDNAIGGTGSAADTQTGSDIVTTSTGAYLFTKVPPGRYYVKVTPPADYTGTGGTPATTDNDIDNNNDGSQPGGEGTPLFSPVIMLAGAAESITDGDTDADTNLTLDFGLWSSVAVGNFIFLDINGDGVRNEGESLGNIFVELYAQGATPGVDAPVSVGSSGCSCKGRYYIEGLNPGNYFLHIPASQFATGMPLEGLQPMSAVVAGDDDAGQDLIYNNDPATNGASTAVFTLRPGQCPAGAAESGGEGTIDDAIDARVDLTRDLGVVAPAGTGFAASERIRRHIITGGFTATVLPGATTFATWSPDSSIGGPADDPDEDGLPNLLEYALGTNPVSPLESARFTLGQDTAGGLIALLTLPVTTHDDILLRLETLTDLTRAADAAAWKPLSMAHTTRFNGDGTLTRQYANLEKLLVFKGLNTGFLRVKVELDANRDGVPEAAVTSSIHAWSRQAFATGARTFSMPLLRPSVFTGRVNTVSGREVVLPYMITLPAGSHYLEAVSGPLAGQRFEIDAAASSGNTVALQDTAPSALADARVVIRPHHTLADLLPPNVFSAEDRVLFFDTAANNFTTLVHGGDAWLHDVLSMNARPFAAHEAALVQVRGPGASLLFTGEVRAHGFTAPLVPGTQLIASGWPASIPAPVTGLRSGPAPDTADRLRLWNGDTTTGASDYTSYYLDNSTGTPLWQLQETANSSFAIPHSSFLPFHGLFLIRETPLLLNQQAPW